MADLRFRPPKSRDFPVYRRAVADGDHPSGKAIKSRAGKRLESGWNPACRFLSGC
jgi:hypothetical protein